MRPAPDATAAPAGQGRFRRLARLGRHASWALLALVAACMACAAGWAGAPGPAIAHADGAADSAGAVQKETLSTGAQGLQDGWNKAAGKWRYVQGGVPVAARWVVTATPPGAKAGQHLQRYWIDASGNLAANRLVDPGSVRDAGAGWWAYATSDGSVVRGKRSVGNRVYLADNDGRLEEPGWLVTRRYDGNRQRYWIDAKAHAAIAGYSKAGWPHYTIPKKGYVVRYAYKVNSKHVLVADNDGRLCMRKGWVSSSKHSPDSRAQRFYFEKVSSGSGLRGARIGLFKVSGKKYYGIPSSGFVLRNAVQAVSGTRYRANSRGVLSKDTLVVYLDAGHGWGGGKFDPGAVGNGYKEANLTSDLAARVLARTKGMAGVKIVDGRRYRLPYWKRNAKAASLGADVILSLHFNAVGKGGTMTLVGGRNRPAKERAFDNIVHPRVVGALGLADRGTFRRGDLAITNGKVPCVLVETCYIDKASEMRTYMKRRNAVAQALADSIKAAAADSRM